MTANGDASCHLALSQDKAGQLKVERVIHTLCIYPHIVPNQCAVHLLEGILQKYQQSSLYDLCTIFQVFLNCTEIQVSIQWLVLFVYGTSMTSMLAQQINAPFLNVNMKVNKS